LRTAVLLPVWPERNVGRFTALLEEGRKIWPHVGAEVRIGTDDWDVAAKTVAELRASGYVAVAHLPSIEQFRQEEGLKWLKGVRPDWAVVHGGTATDGEVKDCTDFVDFLRERAARLRVLAASGVPVFVENAPPREPVRDPSDSGTAAGVRPLVRAGMFARDLLFLAGEAGCGVVADTEHLLDAIAAVREKAKWDGHLLLTPGERDFAGRFGFVVREGEVFWAGDYLYGLNLRGELSLLRANRFHVTGSRAAVSGGAVTSHAEIRDDPFGRYLTRLVLSHRPLSVTVESCHEQGRFDFGVLKRSFLLVLRILREWYPNPLKK